MGSIVRVGASLLPARAKRKTSDDGARKITKVRLVGHEKRYRPHKHYVYILKIQWSDQTEYVIYRSFSMFFQLHTKLLDMFPIEAGVIDSRERILPYLPGRRIFGRNEVQKIAEKRVVSLAEYCDTMIQLDARISQNALFLDFFTATIEDINPPTYSRTKPHKASRLLAALLPFRKKKDKEDVVLGVAPLSEPQSISNPLLLEPYRAVASFTSAEKTEVSFDEGDVVEVVEKHETGWWFVQVENAGGLVQGWAPSSYLDPVNFTCEESEPEPNYEGEKFITTHAYTAAADDELSFEKGVVIDVYHRLLDGWWIASYNGEVGHIPATYLTPYENPHILSVPSVKSHRSLSVSLSVRDTTAPTPRRCSIKTAANINVPKRDLSIYKQFSIKGERQKKDPVIRNLSGDGVFSPLYVNNQTPYVDSMRRRSEPIYINMFSTSPDATDQDGDPEARCQSDHDGDSENNDESRPDTDHEYVNIVSIYQDENQNVPDGFVSGMLGVESGHQFVDTGVTSGVENVQYGIPFHPSPDVIPNIVVIPASPEERIQDQVKQMVQRGSVSREPPPEVTTDYTVAYVASQPKGYVRKPKKPIPRPRDSIARAVAESLGLCEIDLGKSQEDLNKTPKSLSQLKQGLKAKLSRR